jgi:hypothetical protein
VSIGQKFQLPPLYIRLQRAGPAAKTERAKTGVYVSPEVVSGGSYGPIVWYIARVAKARWTHNLESSLYLLNNASLSAHA